MNTRDIEEYIINRKTELVTDSNCNTVFSYSYVVQWNEPSAVSTGQSTLNYYWNLSPNSSVSYYREDPADSDNWVLIETLSYSQLYNTTTAITWQTPYIDTRIKLVFNDTNGCNTFEHIVDPRTYSHTNNLNLMQLKEVPGILEGMSSFEVGKNAAAAQWSTSDVFTYPLTFSIARADGQTSITQSPAQPYNLAGNYTISFPYVYSFSSNLTSNLAGNKPVFGDLPLGDYIVTITDGCGYSVTRTISLTKPAAYSPTVTYQVGCATSNVLYDMGQNANVQPYGRVYLYQNNGGSLGSLVQTYSPDQLLEGQFNNVAPGDYFIVFRNINYSDYIMASNPYHSTVSTRSVARNISGLHQEYRVAATVNPYVQMSFNTTSLFCNTSDANSGILAITTTGIPVGFIKYDIWSSTANPDTDAPLQTYTTTNLTETEHVFTGLSAGDYIVRVSNECGFTQQSNTVIPGALNVPDPTASPDKICTPGEDVQLSVPLPTSLFDIEWFDGSMNSIGTGNTITVNPAATSTYTVKYSVKASFGCTGTTPGTKTITVEVGNCFCYKDPATSGTTLDTNYGITALGRAGANGDTWPMVRQGAWTVLEAKTKGFVINRIPITAAVNAIANPVEGMAVYDEQADCLKIYTSTDNGATFKWECFNTQACPD